MGGIARTKYNLREESDKIKTILKTLLTSLTPIFLVYCGAVYSNQLSMLYL